MFDFQSLSEDEWSELLWGATTASDPFLVLKLIVCNPSMPNYVNFREENRTILHHAVAIGNAVCAELLIQNGASIHALELRMWTPLHYAAYHGDIDSISLLLARGASVLLKDYEDKDCLDVAVEYTAPQVVLDELSHSRSIQMEKQKKFDERDTRRQSDVLKQLLDSSKNSKDNAVKRREEKGFLSRLFFAGGALEDGQRSPQMNVSNVPSLSSENRQVSKQFSRTQ